MGGEEYKNEKPLQRLVTTTGNATLIQNPRYNSVTKREGAIRTVDHKRNTNILASVKPLQKDAFEGTFFMGSKPIRNFVSLSCSAFSTAPPSPSNTVIQGDLKKGHIYSGRNKPLQWLFILVLLTSHEAGSPAGNMVGCVFDLLTTSEKVGKWNSQRRLLQLILPHMVDHIFMAFLVPLQTPWTPCNDTIL